MTQRQCLEGFNLITSAKIRATHSGGARRAGGDVPVFGRTLWIHCKWTVRSRPPASQPVVVHWGGTDLAGHKCVALVARWSHVKGWAWI